MFSKNLLFLGALPAIVSAASNADTSLTLLYQNNLNGTDDANHIGFLLLDRQSQAQATKACASFGETLLTKSQILSHSSDIARSLAYNELSSGPGQLYYINGGVVSLGYGQSLNFPYLPRGNAQLPVLCTQSSNENQPGVSVASASNKISIASGGNTYVGYRNKKSFRFLGIPYADAPKRFVYSNLYSGVGKTLDATAYGAQCIQYGSGSENCLFLNIQTPYLPKKGSKKALRPVFFWIHGGGFTGGSGADNLSDGGNLASREDIVVVNINYRLGNFGFFAVPGTNIKGNFGIADQIVALDWTIKNIANFGGDPKKITILGESAGAGSVRTLLGSPKAIGKYVGAVGMSNLGGGVTLGLDGTYATTYSTYLTIAESYAQAGQNIFSAAGCTQTSLSAQIACLQKIDAATLSNLPSARYVVQDGTYVNTPNLNVVKRNPGTAHVPVIFGIVENDGASFSTYPKTPVTSHLEGLQVALGISAKYAQSIIDSKLFPLYNTGNLTLDSFNVSQRVATDTQFRCIDEATVYAGTVSRAFESAYYYEFERSIGGYDPNNLGGPPKTPGYPNGNPNLPYFKLHGADMPWVFGNLSPLRDTDDLLSIQLVSAYFAEFVKTGQPNPEFRYLSVRGYTSTADAIRRTGPWGKVSGKWGPSKLLDYPSKTAGFVDVEQCKWLKYPLTYYLDGGK